MTQVGARELRHKLSEYLARVDGGERFEVTVSGRPVAQLVPLDRGPGHHRAPHSGGEGDAAHQPGYDDPTQAVPGEARTTHRDRGVARRASERSPLSSLYLDSSALTKLVIDEDHSSALEVTVRGRDLVSSRVAVVEVTKAVARNDPEADPEPMLGQLTLIDLDPDLARIASGTGGPALRALDAIHVASALGSRPRSRRS